VTDQEQQIEDLRLALRESVRLQTHYARLLNMLDEADAGAYGERREFLSPDEWMDRLRELGWLPSR
jgi:hypothetical protein